MGIDVLIWSPTVTALCQTQLSLENIYFNILGGSKIEIVNKLV